jgi:uncharacterized glyoxalase superfamily protein PhnB
VKSQRTIEVSVGPTGEITIEAIAFQGADCEKATRFLEEALGAVITRTKKPEYHQRSKRGQGTQQKLGS